MTVEYRVNGGKQVKVNRFHFENVSAFLDWLAEIEKPVDGKSTVTERFHARSQVDNGKRVMREGDTSSVAEAQAMIDKFQDEIPSLRRVWTPTVAGFFPNVPAFLAGEPESMWRMDDDSSDRAPIRIWVGIGSSSSVTREQLIKRGAALAAFALALSERRPVYITPWWDLGNGTQTAGELISFDLKSSPVVLSEIIAALVNPDVTRYLGLHAAFIVDRSTPDSGPWFPNAFNEKWMRECLGCGESDIWMPGIHTTDKMLTDPIGWIKREIAKHIADEDDE